MKKISPEILAAAFEALGYVVDYCHACKVKCFAHITPDGNSAYFFTDEPGLHVPYEIRTLYLEGITEDDVLNYRDQLIVWLQGALSAWKAQRIQALEAEIEKVRNR